MRSTTLRATHAMPLTSFSEFSSIVKASSASGLFQKEVLRLKINLYKIEIYFLNYLNTKSIVPFGTERGVGAMAPTKY